MREKHHRSVFRFLLLPMLMISVVSSQLSCHRIPTSFCCTSRIRDQCPEQCATVQCGTEFIHSLFSTDGSRQQISGGAHDGSASIGGQWNVDAPQRGFIGRDSDSSITTEKRDQHVPTSISETNFGPTNSGDASLNSDRARVSGTSNPQPSTTLPTTSSGFPTLIPFSSQSNVWPAATQTPPNPGAFGSEFAPAPSMGPAPSSAVSNNFGSFLTGPGTPVRIPAPNVNPSNPSPRRDGHRRRTTPDPRIIRPPESLVVIGDYDEDEPPSENAVVDSPQPAVTSPPTFFNQHPPPPLAPSAPSVPLAFSNSGDVTMRSRKEISGAPDSEQKFGVASSGPALSGSSHEWKVSIIPRGQSTKPASVNAIPALMVDGKSDERFNKFYRTIDRVINNLDLIGGNDLHTREEEPQTRLEGSTKDLSVDSSAVLIVSRTTVAPGVTNRVSVVPFRPLHFTAPPPPAPVNGPPGISPPLPLGPSSSSGQCGMSPDFIPCVSTQVASKSLLECCQRKNLPIGCHQLCRYDVTQAEIRAAMDRGQCGIFSVAPFLECASQGKDNSECCRHRGIVQKTGPQCEQFCRPAHGLSALGVQHIVCGNAVGDMLLCHHSGVRI